MKFKWWPGICAVLGTISLLAEFKAAKACTSAEFSALAPLAVGVAFAAFILAVWLTRYVSIASLAAAVALA